MIEPAPFDARRTTANIIGNINRIEQRLYVALAGSISCLTTIRSPQAPRNEITTEGSPDPLLDTWAKGDARTTAAMHTLYGITPSAATPPPAAKIRQAAAWTRDTCGQLNAHTNDLHDCWWNELDHLRLSWVLALRVLEDSTRTLRNQLDWTTVNQPARPENLLNRRCDDPATRGCTRVIRDNDGHTRRSCGACRTYMSRTRP